MLEWWIITGCGNRSIGAQEHLALRLALIDIVDELGHLAQPDGGVLVGLMGQDQVADRHLLPQDMQARGARIVWLPPHFRGCGWLNTSSQSPAATWYGRARALHL